MSQDDTAHAWWSRLRHQGLLLSPVVMLERYPSAPEPAPFCGDAKLRDAYNRFVSTAEASEGRRRDREPAILAWVDALLEQYLGHALGPAGQAERHPREAHRRRPHRHPLRDDPPAPGRLRRRQRHGPGAAGHGRHLGATSAGAGDGTPTPGSWNCSGAPATGSGC